MIGALICLELELVIVRVRVVFEFNLGRVGVDVRASVGLVSVREFVYVRNLVSARVSI